jgi:GH25 family lysozyme M1 (1,4-beta-N-acetylmuramidase)
MNNEYINKARIIRIVMITAICLLFIATVTLSVSLSFAVRKANEEASQNDALAAMAQATPKDFVYPESSDVVTISDAYLGEISIPAHANVPKAGYDYSKMVYENGRYKYVQDDFVTSYTGIDVSRHNGTIDWAAVAADGIDFAMIRCAYRGYSEGEIKDDSKFTENIEGALAAGIPVGVYFYTQAITPEEAIEEAKYTLELIKNYEITYPVAFDVEITSAEGDGEPPRQNGVSGILLTEITKAFCEEVRAAGYVPMIFTNLRMAYLKLDMRQLAEYDFWISEWRDEKHDPTFYYDYQIWQYASDGEVAGIEGNTDLNICFAHYEKLRADKP